MPSRKRMKESDYSRVEDYISKVDMDTQRQYGQSFDEMDNETKQQFLLDTFFEGNPKHSGAAQQMRQALDEYEGHPLSNDEFNVDHVTMRGRSYTILRNPNGTIRRWVRD